MGGSGGGGWYSSTTPGRTLKDLQNTNQKNESQQNYNRQVNDYLQSLLGDLNNRDAEQINRHLETLKQALEKDADGVFEMRYGGSVSKHTYADGLSDIDLLVNINRSDLASKNPRDVLEEFAARIHSRLPNTKVRVGALAVTVEFSSGYEIQLLPSIKTATGNKIPKPGLNEWSNVIKPHKFAEKLTEVNQANGGKVIPIIKLFKNINSTLPETRQLSGYHIESMAIGAFKNPGDYPSTYKGMLEHFCLHAEKAVLKPIADHTGQSVHVDGYLGNRNSIQRQRVSQSMKILGKKISQANSEQSVESWNDLLGD